MPDMFLDMLKAKKHPNCTLYLIWHYYRRGQLEEARAECARDGDKLAGGDRVAVERILEMDSSQDDLTIGNK